MRLRKSKTFMRRQIAKSVSAVSRYCDHLIQWLPLPQDHGEQLRHCDCPDKRCCTDLEELRQLASEPDSRTAILLNGNFNHHHDIQKLLTELKAGLGRGSRVIAICYNPYLRLAYRLADALGLREAPLPTTFVTLAALSSIARTSGYEIVRARSVGHCPFELMGLGALINRLFAAIPLLRSLALTAVVVLRPVIRSEQLPSVSVVIPARDERGNVEACLERLPDFGGADVEVVFVEGHSTDGTWDEILRVVEAWKGRVDCVAVRQQGEGKADAVRCGFARATRDLLVILDGDLTMPPEHHGRRQTGNPPRRQEVGGRADGEDEERSADYCQRGKHWLPEQNWLDELGKQPPGQ